MLERVQKIICNSGYTSRRKAEELIALGRVKVNGRVIKLGDKADTIKDLISVDDEDIKPQKKIYLALNKPRGVITTSFDDYNRKKVTDLVNTNERIFPVGRLDRDATGLIFLTNDGDFANNVMHPRYEVMKVYFVKLDNILGERDKQMIEHGFKLDDGFIRANVKMISKKDVEITIHEGRNKIVKRIFNHVGYRVLELCRIKIGNVSLGSLKQGKYRDLTSKEVEEFKNMKPVPRKKNNRSF